MERLATTITVNASGDGVGYIDPTGPGRVLAIRYVKDDYVNNVTLAVTGEKTGIAILTLGAGAMDSTVTKYPRAAAHAVADGAALHYNDESDEPVVVPIPVIDERIKLVVAAGGNGTSGTFYVWVG